MNDSKTSKICVVMPTYNNAGTLRDMVERTLQFCPDVQLTSSVSWFCKKFDYRYADEPWKNSKDSVERAMAFLRCDIHRK